MSSIVIYEAGSLEGLINAGLAEGGKKKHIRVREHLGVLVAGVPADRPDEDVVGSLVTNVARFPRESHVVVIGGCGRQYKEAVQEQVRRMTDGIAWRFPEEPRPDAENLNLFNPRNVTFHAAPIAEWLVEADLAAWEN